MPPVLEVTLPVVGLGEMVKAYVLMANVAVTDLATVMDTTQDPVPEQDPPQPVKEYPVLG